MAVQEAVDAKKVQELEKQLQYNEKLKFVTNRIHSAKNVTEILVQLQSEILSLFDADRITIYAVDPVKKELYSKHMAGSEVKEIRVAISPASVAGFAARTAKILNISDVYNAIELKRISPELKFDKSWDQKTGYRSKQMLVVPIINAKQLLGVIQLLNKRSGGTFTKADERNIVEVARILGIAFINQSKMSKTRFDYLTSNNIISESELKQATSSARELKKDVESMLIENFKVKKVDIGKSLSQFFGCPFIENPNTVVYDRKLLTGLNLGFLKRAYWVPIQLQDGKVTILIDNPRDRKVVDIKSLVRAREYTFQVAMKDDILKVIELMQKGDSKVGGPVTAGGVAGENLSDILEEMDVKEGGDVEEEGESAEDEHSGAIVRLVNQIIIDGYEKGASDIHVEPSKKAKKTFIRFRVDGTCFKHLEIPYTHSRALSSRIKIMATLDISERRLPQDGKIKFFYKDKQIELRVATLPTVGGEDVVMRILAASEPMPVEKLNLNNWNLNEFKKIVVKPYGIILVVGPTGSGKTTTLHAAVGYINKPERKIWTAEDPVEITQEGLRQVEVKPKIKFTFASAMRAFLRADPDVILVGEMRDHETAAIGIEASLTGHLVFSTLHTNSAPETITRLIDMDIDPFNFADALLGILAQRLVRTLCKKCKEKYHPTQQEYNELIAAYGEKFWPELNVKYDDNLMLYRAKGCHDCNETGYKGRTGLHELLVGTDEIKAVIQSKAAVEVMRDQAVKDGMRTLYQDGVMKILKGDTDHKQVRSVCIK
jgi:type II secretory ATPase GspE/PulE/Tfp pilus assembly ATPase PilB-like protein/putative methionine-R-sulfoxide reductase with GAF domain